MTIARQLVEFSGSRPAWQQDLIRRICTQPALQNSDVEQALHNLKASHGLAAVQEMTPLRVEHLTESATGPHIPVVLAAISNVRNANQLAPNQRLPFALDGITLIYGHNGSGKTGYARIVKQLCRARRDKAEPLLGNVYKGSNLPAEAEITYLVGGEKTELSWKDGATPPAPLSQISVFDAASAPLYADHQNEIEFLPWGLDVLPNLGRVCQTLAQQLQVEIDRSSRALSIPLPQQISGTPAEALIRRLTPDNVWTNLPSEEEIGRAGRWLSQDDEELKQVETEIQKLSEPAKAAAQCRRFRVSIDAFKDKLVAIHRHVSPEAIATYREQFVKTEVAMQAASVAAARRFDGDPLGASIGTQAWQKMYEFAEQFNSIAYPGDPFPALGEDRVCVLCQQPYSGQAADRMKRFKQFMQDTSQQEARTENTRLSAFISDLEGTRPPTAGEMGLQFAELSAAEPSFTPVRAGLDQYVSQATAIRQASIGALNGHRSFAEIPTLDRDAIGAAENFGINLEQRAKAFDQATTDNTATSALKQKHTELLARKQLNSSLATAVSRRAEIENHHRLKKCKEHCDTTQISRKNSDFRDTYLTADFEKKVRQQVKVLGLGYLPIKIDAKTEKGTSYVGVSLSKMVNARNASILSEGEFRALALACFFAEIANIPHHNGIVIDDPVSSLDHRHMKQVARRLVEEAKLRSQVIVFTHDFSFYYELWSAAAEAQVPILRHWVRHVPPAEFGIVDVEDGPWEVKTTKERVGVLTNMLMKIPEEGLSSEDYAQYVRGFYARLRETWERLIEECLLRKVVGRFQPGVQTQALRGVSVTGEDYSMVHFNMKKVSEFSGHDWAGGREGTPPSREDMKQDLAILKRYREDLDTRSKKLEGERRDLEQPPTAQSLPSNPS